MAYHQSRCSSNGVSRQAWIRFAPPPHGILADGRPPIEMQQQCSVFRQAWIGFAPAALCRLIPCHAGALYRILGKTPTLSLPSLFHQSQLQQQRQSRLGDHSLHEFPDHNSSPKSAARPRRDSDNNSTKNEILLSVEAHKVFRVLPERADYLFHGLCPPCLHIVLDCLNSLARGDLSSIKTMPRLESSGSPSGTDSSGTLTDPLIAFERLCLNGDEAAYRESNSHIEPLSSNNHAALNSREADGEDEYVDETAASGRTEQAKQRKSHPFQLKRKKSFALMERVNGRSINVVQGLELYENVFNANEQRQLVNFIDELPKNKTISNSKPHASHMEFGHTSFDMDELGHLVSSQAIETIPNLFKVAIKQMKQLGVVPDSCEPNNCRIDIHDEGTYVLPRKEQLNICRPFLILSLLNNCNIIFGSKLEGHQSADPRGLSVLLQMG